MRADPPVAAAPAFPRATWRALRSTRLILHLGWGLIFVGLLFPLLRPNRRLKFRQRWSRQALSILAIRADADVEGCTAGSLYVANHVSWLDILALNAARPDGLRLQGGSPRMAAARLARGKQRHGLRRGSRGHARLVNAEIDALLDAWTRCGGFP